MLLYKRSSKTNVHRWWTVLRERKFAVVDLSVLPPVYQKVLRAKELLESGQAETASCAADMANISRSAYYKYKDCIFNFDQMQGVLTLLIVALDLKGVLSDILSAFSESGCNILTINQNLPINGVANITITAQTERMKISTDKLITLLNRITGVRNVTLLARQ